MIHLSKNERPLKVAHINTHKQKKLASIDRSKTTNVPSTSTSSSSSSSEPECSSSCDVAKKIVSLCPCPWFCRRYKLAPRKTKYKRARWTVSEHRIKQKIVNSCSKVYAVDRFWRTSLALFSSSSDISSFFFFVFFLIIVGLSCFPKSSATKSLSKRPKITKILLTKK